MISSGDPVEGDCFVDVMSVSACAMCKKGYGIVGEGLTVIPATEWKIAVDTTLYMYMQYTHVCTVVCVCVYCSMCVCVV